MVVGQFWRLVRQNLPEGNFGGSAVDALGVHLNIDHSKVSISGVYPGRALYRSIPGSWFKSFGNFVT